MGWHETYPEQERLRFFNDWKSRKFSMSDLYFRYKISRKTGYKFINRICTEGTAAAQNRSSAKINYPNLTKPEIALELMQTKVRYPHWGPAKIRDYLKLNAPNMVLPATSTIGDLFKRNGLVKPRRKRKKVPVHTKPLSHCKHPNAVWSVDFKGQFKLGNGEYCYPLTISDNYSRYLICCESLKRPTLENTQNVFLNIFETYGLPDAIRSDNGQPFAGLGIGGLTKLSSWWLKLGINPERIAPGRPDQNGRHERMHRTLKQATANPPQMDENSQQECFVKFIEEYNNERPHEALGGLRPADIYRPSKRFLPEILPVIKYPKEYQIRRVKNNGDIKWCNKRYYISDVLRKEYVGLEIIDEGRAIICFASKQLGIIDARKDKIEKL